MDRSNAFRSDALALSNQGHYGLALSKIHAAIEASKNLPIASHQSVEAYDDAGLYYFMIDDFKNSAYHQSVAVLLSYKSPASEAMYPVYLKRLGWAFAKYAPDYEFDRIIKHPLILLSDTNLNLKSNQRIRSRYFRRAHSPGKIRRINYTLKSHFKSPAFQ